MNETPIEAMMKMQRIMAERENAPQLNVDKPVELNEKEYSWLKANCPPVDDNQFLVILEFKDSIMAACIKDIDWYAFAEIELAAYRKSDIREDTNFYMGEYERREVLDKTIEWVADITSEEIIKKGDVSILNRLPDELAGLLWNRYYPLITLTSHEASALYNSAVAYFTGNVKNKPIPPIVIEVAMLIKFGNMTRSEIRRISASDMERIQLILKARAEALNLTKGDVKMPNQEQQSVQEFMGTMTDMPFPNNFLKGMNVK